MSARINKYLIAFICIRYHYFTINKDSMNSKFILQLLRSANLIKFYKCIYDYTMIDDTYILNDTIERESDLTYLSGMCYLFTVPSNCLL